MPTSTISTILVSSAWGQGSQQRYSILHRKQLRLWQQCRCLVSWQLPSSRRM
uniref:Uncharacterized protein n=1 Tax=Arundo donax TaxID=35708 RepID=A0A0A9GMN7_ARUDO